MVLPFRVVPHGTKRAIWRVALSLPRIRDRIGESQLDECLAADADSLRLAVDRLKQIDREVDVDALDFTARTGCFCQIQMRAEVLARLVHRIETRSAQCPTLRSSAPLHLHARGGPR